MSKDLKQIREACDLSIANFAACIGLKKATYQCYEDGSRKAPPEVMEKAQTQLERTRAYWAGMDQRIDERLKGRGVPNEARG